MKLYDEEQIGAILKRAAEKSTVDQDSHPGTGLSIEELKQLGADAGIDPELIAESARELSLNVGGKKKPTLWGSPYSFSEEITISRTVTSEDWEEMLPEIRRHFGDPGVVSTRGSTFEWTPTQNILAEMAGHVSVREVDGRSKVSVFWKPAPVAIALLIPAVLFGLIGLPVIIEGVGMDGISAFFTFAAILTTLLAATGFGVSKIADKRIQRIDNLLLRLERIAEKSGSEDSREHLEISSIETDSSSESDPLSQIPGMDLSDMEQAEIDTSETRRSASRSGEL